MYYSCLRCTWCVLFWEQRAYTRVLLCRLPSNAAVPDMCQGRLFGLGRLRPLPTGADVAKVGPFFCRPQNVFGKLLTCKAFDPGNTNTNQQQCSSKQHILGEHLLSQFVQNLLTLVCLFLSRPLRNRRAVFNATRQAVLCQQNYCRAAPEGTRRSASYRTTPRKSVGTKSSRMVSTSPWTRPGRRWPSGRGGSTRQR